MPAPVRAARPVNPDETLPVKSLDVANLTVFTEARLTFGRHLNVLVGANGTGKTHLLKLIYCIVDAIGQAGRPHGSAPTKSVLQGRIADKLVNVFRPESLGRLVRRRRGRQRCDVAIALDGMEISFDFASNSKTEVNLQQAPPRWLDSSAVYLPTRELLSVYPNFVPVYESHILDFEETWRDTCLLLGLPLQRGPRLPKIAELLRPLEQAMGGQIEADANGRFYLRTEEGRTEMPLVAEGLRKLGMIARLIATGALVDNGYLFWDEPEAGLNPLLMRQAARTIIDLAASGTQVFIATHSLFLLRELEIILADPDRAAIAPRFFGLHPGPDGATVAQGTSISDIGPIASLDEDLEQSDRFLSTDT